MIYDRLRRHYTTLYYSIYWLEFLVLLDITCLICPRETVLPVNIGAQDIGALDTM